MRTLWLVLIGMWVSLCGARANAQSEMEIQLDIDPQVLADALNEWAQAAGFRWIGPAPATRSLWSPRLHGAFTPQAALGRLLEGTTLTYEFIDDRTVAIHERLPDPSVPGTKGKHSLRLTAAQETGRAENTLSADRSNPKERQRGTLEEIIVTAQKREQSLHDVPISISVLGGQYLEDAGISNISEMTYTVPGLSSVEIGPGFQNITIRGVGNLRGTASLIGLYLDEAAVAGANEQQIDLRLFDLARVEVLRGPQGTLYGEGSMGGTIRYITNDPDLNDFGGNFDVSVSDTKQGGASEAAKAVVNVPIVDGKFGIRVAARYEDSSGWIDQPSAGRKDINNSDLTNIRVKALWRVNDDLNIKATAIAHRNEGDGYNYVNLGTNDDSAYIPPLSPTTVTPYQDDYEHYGLTLDYEVGFGTLVSASSYTEMDKFTLQRFFFYLPPAGSPPQGYNEFTNQDIRILTQELRLTSSDTSELKWTVGGFYRDAEDFNLADFNYEGFLYNGDTLESSESVAVFGDAEYALTDRLSVGAGARYFEDRRSLADRLAGTTLRKTFHAFSPRGYLSFDATDSIKAYASASKGFRSGGFNEARSIALGVPVGFEPEVLWSYELGTKMNLLAGRVAADLAIFYSDYEDYVSLGLLPGSAVLTQVFNTGTVEIRGVEWALRWNALENLALGVNGSVVDAEITKITAINPPATVGDRPDNTPSNEYSAFVDSSFRWSESVEGFLRLNYNVQGKMYFHCRGCGGVAQYDSSDRVAFMDVQVGAQWDRWKAELFGTNVLDETGFITPYTSYRSGAQARRRSFGLRVGAEF